MRREARTQVGGKPIALSSIGVIAAYPEFRSACRKRLLPASAQIGLPAPSGLIEQTNVGESYAPVQLRSKAVRRNVDYPPAARHGLPHAKLNLRAIRPVMLFDNLRAQLRRHAARGRREEIRVANRAIEVDQEATHGRGYDRRPKGLGQRPGYGKRTGIVPAVGVQQRLPPPKEPSIGGRYAVAAVLTGDEEGVDRCDRLPLQFGQLAKYLSRAFAPFVAQRREICVSVVEPPPPPHFEAVSFIANQVDRHTYRQVAAHGRIE